MNELEKHYLKQAEEIIDTMFDNGYFAKELKREDMRKLDELFAFYIQSAAQSAVRTHDLLRRIRNTDPTPDKE